MKKRSKIKIIILAVFILFIMIPIVFLSIAYYIHMSKYRFVEECYHSDSQSFNEMSAYFGSLHKENLYYAEYNVESKKLNLYFRHQEENENGYSSEENHHIEESLEHKLTELKEKYQVNSIYPVFSSVNAVYDENVNMLLYIQVLKEPIKKKRNIEYTKDLTCYYLVYSPLL